MSTDNGPAGTQPAGPNSGFRGWLRATGVPTLAALTLAGGIFGLAQVATDDSGEPAGGGQAACQQVPHYDVVIGYTFTCAVGGGAGGGGGGGW